VTECVASARGVSKRFGPLVALHPLDLELHAGETVGVLGPNGAGKSTLLRILAGLTRPSRGEIELAGARSRVARRGLVGLVAHATFLYPSLTARENLELAGRLYAVPKPRDRAVELVHQHELAPVADRLAGALSRGWAQRVAIARALVHDPPILLLDEPFTGLDSHASTVLAERLGAQRSAARSGLLVTHDLDRAAALCDRALVLVRGRAGWLEREDLGGTRVERAYLDLVSRLDSPA
jgi:ABC-type multidrug transport system ATPase subunit